MTWNRLTVGSWVSTSDGCPVKTVISKDDVSVTFVFGSSGNEFELTMDPTTLAELLRLGSKASSALGRTVER